MTDISVVKGDFLATSSVAIGHPTTHVYDNDNLNVLDLSGSLIFRGSGSAPLSPVGAGSIVYDPALQKLRVSENGGAYSNLVGSVGGGITSSAGINLTTDQGLYAGNADLGTLQFRTLLPGTGMGFVSGSQTLMISYTGSTGGAPIDAPYIVLAGNPTLTNERVLTGTANQITITDNGAGNSVVLSLPQSINTFSSPTFGNLNVASVLTASSIALATLGAGSTNNINIPTQDNQQLQLVAGADFTKGAGWLVAGRNASNGLTNRGSILGNIGNIDGTNFFALQNNSFSGSTATLIYINGGSQHTFLAPSNPTGFVAVGVGPFAGTPPTSQLDLSGSFTVRDMGTAPSVAPANQLRLYYDRATQKTKISENGGAYRNLGVGGLSGSIQFNSVNALSGAARVQIENTGNLFLTDNTFEPWSPNLSGAVVYNKFRAGRHMVAVNDKTRWDYSLQPFLATNKVNMWTAYGNSNSTSSTGFNSITTGTLAVRNVLATNMFTSLRRQGFETAAAVSGVAGTRHAVTQFWRGNAPLLGGFYYLARYGIGSGAQGAVPHFVGLTGSTIMPIAGSNPSQLFNLVGIGCDVGDTNLSFYNAGSTTRTKTSLGSTFPVIAPFSSDIYEIRLFTPPQGAVIFYSVERLNTGDLIEGFVDGTTSDIPGSSTFLSPIVWISTKSASVASIDLVSQYLETDN